MKNIKRSQIWDVDLKPTKGAEIEKERPCVVVSSDRMHKIPLKLVVPVTGWNDHYQNYIWHIKIKPNPQNGLTKISSANAFQVRTVSVERFTRYRGYVSQDVIDDIVSAIAIVVELDSLT